MDQIVYGEYRGVVYAPYLDVEEDNQKIFHELYAYSADGKPINVPWKYVPDWFLNISPYREATKDEFERAVDEMLST